MIEVVVCGAGQEQEMLTELIKDELGQEVGSFDPFEGIQLSAELSSHKPSHPGRFAPLLGMLLDEAQGVGHAIDFLHPRQAAQPGHAIVGGLAIPQVRRLIAGRTDPTQNTYLLSVSFLQQLAHRMPVVGVDRRSVFDFLGRTGYIDHNTNQFSRRVPEE